MTSSAVRPLAAAFCIAFVGWLAAGALRVTSDWVYLAALVVGTLAGAVSGRVVAVVGAWLGILAAYPVALQVGLIAFLGDGWPIAVLVIQVVVSLGFLAGIVLSRRRAAAPMSGRAKMRDAN